MNWFIRHCDGEWENDHGLSIESCDNPGWWLKVDLGGTVLEGRPFTPIKRGDTNSKDPQPPWLHCYIEGQTFNGAGDPSQLEEILQIFLDWAEASENTLT